MRYSDFRSVHIPLGSGVTEAACKTVFTQRLKSSGMRWSHEGAKTILTLRAILLSKSWALTYTAALKSAYPDNLRPYQEKQQAEKGVRTEWHCRAVSYFMCIVYAVRVAIRSGVFASTCKALAFVLRRVVRAYRVDWQLDTPLSVLAMFDRSHPLLLSQ
jgi:hypothetical protein